MIAALALCCSTAMALNGNDELELRLSTGVLVHGWFYAADAGIVTVSGQDRFTEVPVSLVVAVKRRGADMPLPEFRAELDAYAAELQAYRDDPPVHPAPALVAGVSMLWAGAGHATLGDFRGLARYSVIEAVLVGTAVLTISQGGPNPAILVPLAGVDLVIRGYAAGESVRETRRRRARLGPGGGAPSKR